MGKSHLITLIICMLNEKFKTTDIEYYMFCYGNHRKRLFPKICELTELVK